MARKAARTVKRSDKTRAAFAWQSPGKRPLTTWQLAQVFGISRKRYWELMAAVRAVLR